MHQEMEAYRRAISSVPPATVSELRPHAPLGLYCSIANCPACLRFAAAREAFETTLSSQTKIVEWDCDRDRCRQFVSECGITSVPAYLMIPRSGPPFVVVPPP